MRLRRAATYDLGDSCPFSSIFRRFFLGLVGRNCSDASEYPNMTPVSSIRPGEEGAISGYSPFSSRISSLSL